MIDKISFTDFRKFKNLELDVGFEVVILSGANAIGKTSVLEGINIASTTKSHRTNNLEECINDQRQLAKIKVKTDRNTYDVSISKDSRNYSINDVSYPKLSNYLGNLLVTMVSPLDIALVNGSKGYRRRFLDLEISMMDKAYLRTLTAYRKLLKERNEILKVYNEEQKAILNILTEQLCEQLLIAATKRFEFIAIVNIKLKEVCKRLGCEEIFLKYVASYDLKNLQKTFLMRLNFDLKAKTTTVGLHRDDFKIYIADQVAEVYSSEGQARTIVLAIKLAVALIAKEHDPDVVLLLDDIFSGLDQKRINAIMSYIKDESQTFITTTSIINVPDELIRQAKIIKL